jgi:hypothetical protein
MARVQLRVTEWNAERLLGRSTQILEEFAPIIAEEARRQITTVKWDWPNSTLRYRSLFQGGTTVRTTRGTGVRVAKGKRDIVDTGTLLSSQQTPQVSDGTLVIRWTAPYAGEVLRGSYPDRYFSPITRELVGPAGNKPRRNWIEGALQAQPVLPFFVGRWRALAGR